MFGWFGGSKVMNEIADEIGIERKIFKTALTEVQVNFAIIRNLKNQIVESGTPESEAIKELSIMCFDNAHDGLLRLEARFPNQPEINRAKSSLLRFYNSK